VSRPELAAAVEKLPEEFRPIFRLVIQGKEPDEIAEELGMDPELCRRKCHEGGLLFRKIVIGGRGGGSGGAPERP
jgi:DNA-directed RNA polymerase specialized sigma24 family protein